jgi:hypothetical protein
MSHRTPHRPVVIQALRRVRRDSSSSDQARQPNHGQKARPDGVTRASASERNRRPSRTSPRRQQERASFWRCPDPVVLRRPAARNPSATISTESAFGTHVPSSPSGGYSTVCEATARARLPWERAARAEGTTYPRCTQSPGRRSRHASGIASIRRRKRADPLSCRGQTYLVYSHLSVLPTL